MGKDLRGKELGKGISQRKDKRYEARAVINGQKIDLYDFNLEKLKKDFDREKEKVIRMIFPALRHWNNGLMNGLRKQKDQT